MKIFFKKFLSILILSQITFPGWVMAFVPQSLDENNLPYVKWEIIVKYKDSYTDFAVPNNVAEFEKNIEKSGSEVEQVWSDENMALITDEVGVFEKILLQAQGLPERDIVPEMIKLYEANPNVEFVQPNYVYRFNSDENLENNFSDENIENSLEKQEENLNNENLENSENNSIEDLEKISEEKSEENNSLEKDEKKFWETKTEENSEKIFFNNLENEKSEEKIEENLENYEWKKFLENKNNEDSEIQINEKIFVNFPEQNSVNENVENYENNIIFTNQIANSVANSVDDNPLVKKFNDKYAKYQWYLHNVGQELPNTNIQPLKGTAWVDIGYLKAKSIYDVAKARQTEEQRNKKIVVAIIDTGVDFGHPDLAHAKWRRDECRDANNQVLRNCDWGFSSVTNTVWVWNIRHSHGTNVAGLIAAKANNNDWIIGIASNDVEIMSINIMWENGSTTQSVINAFKIAKNNNADIVSYTFSDPIPNMMLTGKVGPYDLSLEPNIDNFKSWWKTPSIGEYFAFKSFDWPIIAAAWNVRSWSLIYNFNEIFSSYKTFEPVAYKVGFRFHGVDYPGLSNMVIVANSNSLKNRWHLSYYGNIAVDLFAPGTNIVTTHARWINTDKVSQVLSPEDYDITTGTSFAAPITLASLVFAKYSYPEKSFQELISVMKETVTVVPSLSNAASTSWILNLGAMMEKLEIDAGYNPNPPVIEIIPSTTEQVYWELKLTLTSDKPIKTPEWWTKITDKTYELKVFKNQTITVDVEDVVYWTATRKTYIVDNVIEKLNVKFTTTPSTWTKENVLVKINLNKLTTIPSDWTRIDDYNFSKIFTENQEIKLELTDSNWESAVFKYNLDKIDKTLPILSINSSYREQWSNNHIVNINFSATDNSNSNLIYKCKSNELDWQTCSSPFNWLLSNPWENTFQIKAIDLAGNESNIETININRYFGINITRISDQEVGLGIELNPITINLSERANVEVTWLPEGLNFDSSTLQITWKPKKLWNFPVTIKVTDSNNNSSKLVFSILVKDKTSPTISINWNKYTSTGSIINLKNQNLWPNNPIKPIKIEINEPWTLIVDWLPDGVNYDSNTGIISGTPTTVFGQETTLNIRATDMDWNVTHIRFNLIVKDATPPVITVNWSLRVSHNSNKNYSDLGATCSDDIDTTCIVEVQNLFNNSPWENKIIYTATDSAGNTSTITRIINVYSLGPGGPTSGGSNSWDLDYRNSDLPNLPTFNTAPETKTSILEFNELNNTSLATIENSNMNYSKKMSILSWYANYYFIKIFDEKSQISLTDRQKYIQEYIKILELADKINNSSYSKFYNFDEKIFYILDIEK